MRSLTFFLCGALLVSLATTVTLTPSAWCAGPNWVLLDENGDSRYYFDQSGLNKPKEGIIRVRTRVVYTEAGKADALKILSTARKFEKLFESRYLHDLDCRKTASRLLEATHLDDKGATLKSTELATITKWEDIPPDARIALVSEKVCTR